MTTVVGLITDNDETANREEVWDLTVWCKDNNLSLNVIKTKDMIVDSPPPLHADHGDRGLFSRKQYILRVGLVRIVKRKKGFC